MVYVKTLLVSVLAGTLLVIWIGVLLPKCMGYVHKPIGDVTFWVGGLLLVHSLILHLRRRKDQEPHSGVCVTCEGHWRERRCLSHVFKGTYNPAATPQGPPSEGTEEIVLLVIRDIQDRAKYGERLYGTPLQGFNGRDSFMDAYQEALDLPVYLRQFKYELDEVLDQVEGAIRHALDYMGREDVELKLDLALMTLVNWRARGLSFKGSIGDCDDAS